MGHLHKVLALLDWPGARPQATQDRSSGADLANPWAAPAPTRQSDALVWRLTLGTAALGVVALTVGAVAHYLHPGPGDGQNELLLAAFVVMTLSSGSLQALRAGDVTRPGWWQRPYVATVLRWTSVLASVAVIVLAGAAIASAF